MIPQEVIDQILDHDIVDILKREGLDVKRSGVNFTCSCPFHADKTPSFVVSSTKNIWKCFSCGKGGTAMTYIQQVKNMNFPEACEYLCGMLAIDYAHEDPSPDELEKRFARSQIYQINLEARDYYVECYKQADAAQKYALSKRGLSEDIVLEFHIGYAREKGGFLDYARQKGYKDDVLLRSGLVKISDRDGSLYDTFRGRLMFPIHERTGNIVGFSGRLIKADPESKFPKYLNTGETEVFTKGNNLFGYFEASTPARATRVLHLVEGNLDAIRMHQISVENTVAALGTALTPIQIALIARVADTVIIIGDVDEAGVKAVVKNGEALIRAGLSVRVMTLPGGGRAKVDADDYFRKHPDNYKNMLSRHTTEYIPWLCEREMEGKKSDTERIPIVARICTLLASCRDERVVSVYLEDFSKRFKPAKLWTSELQRIKNEQERKRMRAESADDEDMRSNFGFFIHNNHYLDLKNHEWSNYILIPVLHIRDPRNAKRIFRIINSDRQEQIVKFKQEDLVSFQSFKSVTESMGNFVWLAGQNELTQLKRYLYKDTRSADEVKQIGWQKRQQIYIWGNGAFDGTAFNKIDDFGIVEVNGSLLYIPGCAKDTEMDIGAYQTQRKFVYLQTNNVTMSEYSRRFCDVFGDNAKISLCFLIASLFRDIVVNTTTSFPLLNIFGPKGTGKTNCARSLMAFFMRDYHPLNIMSTTRAALGEVVAEISNGIVHIDEYKNCLELEKREFLKGIWDGTGRNKMNVDNDKRRETTQVDCGVILTGQEMPTADPALFSRLLFLSFYKTTFTTEEKQHHDQLKLIEQRGLTHLTEEILKLRTIFRAGYRVAYDDVSRDFLTTLGNTSVEDRTFKNWVSVIAAYKCIDSKIDFPFTYAEILQTATQMCVVQDAKTSSSSELAGFWESVEALVSSAKVFVTVDYHIKSYKRPFRIRESNIPVELPAGKKILQLRFNRVAQLYAREARETESKKIPKDSLKYYLETAPEFLGTNPSVRFKVLESQNTIRADETSKATITQAMIFDYDAIVEKYGIEMDVDTRYNDVMNDDESDDYNGKL